MEDAGLGEAFLSQSFSLPPGSPLDRALKAGWRMQLALAVKEEEEEEHVVHTVQEEERDFHFPSSSSSASS